MYRFLGLGASEMEYAVSSEDVTMTGREYIVQNKEDHWIYEINYGNDGHSVQIRQETFVRRWHLLLQIVISDMITASLKLFILLFP